VPDFYEAHRGTIDRAVEAISARTYWSAFPEHPKAYGEDAPAAGQEAFDAMRGHPFTMDQKSFGYGAVAESSPYGLELGIEYPSTTVDATIEGAVAAMRTWGRATPETRAGACLEILDRLSKDSFTMAHAVMHTTGQSFLMAFQAGGPHALDRALEAVAYAYHEQTRIPDPLRWEKPQGQRDPLVIDKRWIIRPRGVAVAIGVSTFPTWNGYPGIFASLAAGNPVIVKPHPETILPFAILVRTARAVMSDAGFDPDVVQLLVDTPDSPVAKDLVMRPEVGIVDYTGGSAFGRWLEEHVTHADVYTEKAGVNSVILDSVRDLSAVLQEPVRVDDDVLGPDVHHAPEPVHPRVGGEGRRRRRAVRRGRHSVRRCRGRVARGRCQGSRRPRCDQGGGDDRAARQRHVVGGTDPLTVARPLPTTTSRMRSSGHL
jgi:phenylacetic acid degradation protein paaN